MNIKQVDNTNQIPGRDFIAVQSKSDADAEALLQRIAERLGVTLEIAYRFGAGYYYSPVPLEVKP